MVAVSAKILSWIEPIEYFIEEYNDMYTTHTIVFILIVSVQWTSIILHSVLGFLREKKIYFYSNSYFEYEYLAVIILILKLIWVPDPVLILILKLAKIAVLLRY
jgi:hypothetical protein